MPIQTKEAPKKPGKSAVKDQSGASLMVESEEEEEEEEDEEELEPDEFVVDKITNHVVDEHTGELTFEVKWEGYEKKSERTWEPEESLETASKILNEYLASVGGKEAILVAYEKKKAAVEERKKGKKRGRVSTGTPQNGGKKSRKNGHPMDGTPPASSEKEWKPPTGNWEDLITNIDAAEGDDGKVVVFLTWTSGHKSQHPLAQIYKRAPQQMLRFYEQHLVFKKNND